MTSDRMRDLVNLVRSTKAIVQDKNSVLRRVEKGEFDFATEVDTNVQTFIQENLRTMYPAHQFLGEEGAHDALNLDLPTWILDPIDGTTNLIHHYPQCAVALGLMVGREIELGIVYNPFLDQVFYAERGKGAYADGRRIAVSKIDSLHESLISVGTSPYTKEYARNDFGILSRIFERCQDIRRGGSAALDMAYVACGITEAYYERKLKPWDYAAAKIILEEAGGKLTDFSGNPVPVGMPSPCLATNGGIHAEMLSYTQKMVL